VLLVLEKVIERIQGRNGSGATSPPPTRTNRLELAPIAPQGQRKREGPLSLTGSIAISGQRNHQNLTKWVRTDRTTTNQARLNRISENEMENLS
jgi:hypothetical protein